jgi:hypothetical protein
MGIFTAYELMRKAPQCQVLLNDKGHDIMLVNVRFLLD